MDCIFSELDNTGIEKKCHKSTPNPDDKSNDMSQALDVEILTHTLENRTLHKKLAARINREVTLLSSSAEEQGAAIKTVVQKTEEDPIFDKLVADILGKYLGTYKFFFATVLGRNEVPFQKVKNV